MPCSRINSDGTQLVAVSSSEFDQHLRVVSHSFSLLHFLPPFPLLLTHTGQRPNHLQANTRIRPPREAIHLPETNHRAAQDQRADQEGRAGEGSGASQPEAGEHSAQGGLLLHPRLRARDHPARAIRGPHLISLSVCWSLVVGLVVRWWVRGGVLLLFLMKP